MSGSPGPPRGPVPSWRAGHLIWPDGRTKLLALAGAGSRTGAAEYHFAGLMRFLAAHGGYDARRDLLELSYAGRPLDGGWQPRPYTPADTRRPLADSTEAVASALEWYRQALPPETRFALVGYSMGGVLALDGATLAIARDRAGWRGRISAVITLASPVRGCNAGALIHWAWLVTHEPDPLGALGPDLDRRWSDPAEQQRVERRAAFLRASGATLLTLADPDDAVVRPDEALLPAPGQSPDDLLVRAASVRPGTLGHGPLLDEPAAWRRILQTIGSQERLPPAPQSATAPDPVEQELAALKARLRAEGRLR